MHRLVSAQARAQQCTDGLCHPLVNAQARHMGIVRMVDLDPAYSRDGTRDKCTGCGNRHHGGNQNVHCCGDGGSCTEAYHIFTLTFTVHAY